MRKFYLLLLLPVSHLCYSQILGFDFSGLAGSEVSANSTYVVTGVEPSLITRGTGVNAGGNADRFNSTGWTTSPGLDPDDYLEFGIHPSPGYQLTINEIVLQHQRSGTGPSDFVVRTSMDDFANDATNVIGIPDVTNSQNSNFTFLSPLIISSPVTIRLYAYNAEAGGGSWGPGDAAGNDIDVIGTVTAGSGNNITVGSILTSPFCVSNTTAANGIVSFSSIGNFQTQFTALLSDANGDFSSPVNIGGVVVTGTDPAGSIPFIIPQGTPGGNGYRIRIDATDPVTTGIPGPAFEIVNGVPEVSGLSIIPGITTFTINWTNPESCFDEVLIVVQEGLPITDVPSGDGSSYNADLDFTGNGSGFGAGKVVYKGTAVGQTIFNLVSGQSYYIRIFSRLGTTWSNGVEAFIASLGGVDHLVISQIYMGGGNSGATFTNDFVEIFNPTGSAIDLTGKSLQYASSSGTNWMSNKVDLNGLIAAGKYFLVQLNGGMNGIALPAFDQEGDINLSVTGGKLALVNSTNGISDSGCPIDIAIIDFVGYGTSADCREGGTSVSFNAPAGTNTLGLQRNRMGCSDTDNNAADFLQSVPGPRNSSSPANSCLINQGPLPVKFSGVRAIEHPEGILLEWTNEHEADMIHYTIESSPDALEFSVLHEELPKNNNGNPSSYQFLDRSSVTTDHFYRIRAIESNGSITTSPVVRISRMKDRDALVIYPHPVSGSQISLRFTLLPPGKYDVFLINSAGKSEKTMSFLHPGGSFTKTLFTGHLQTGLHIIRISGPVLLTKKFLKL